MYFAFFEDVRMPPKKCTSGHCIIRRNTVSELLEAENVPDGSSKSYEKRKLRNAVRESINTGFSGIQVLYMQPAASAKTLKEHSELPMEKRSPEFVNDLRNLAKEIYKRTLAFSTERTALNCGGSMVAFVEALKILIEEVI